ncbi:MAG: exodeoxyribonuclease V subunit gamma, partial [Chlorobi bacterium]|nr:exodeoxyribonuclease V subunit gamma [Chlorobiota bacterium]
RQRLSDVLAIYERYHALLDKRYRDHTGIFDRVTHALLTGVEIAHPPIVVEGFSEFRIPEQQMLGALAATHVPVCIVLAYSPANGPLFGNLDETYRTLVSLGYTTRAFDPPLEDGGLQWHRPRTAYLRRWLFNVEQEIRNPEFDNIITILGCTNRLEEVTLIAKYVKHCIAERSIKPERICVAMRDPELYSRLFRELFIVHGVPVNISDRFRLDQSPVAVAVMSVLDLIVRGWRREDIHRVLSNPLIHCNRSDGTAVDASTFNDVAERQRISGGHAQGGVSGWLDRLRHALGYAQAYLEALQSQPFADPLDRRQAQQDIEQINRAFTDVEVLSRLLPSHERRLTTSQFCAFVRNDILDRLGITASIEEAFQRIWALQKHTPDDIALAELLEQETRAYTALLDTLSEIEYAWNDERPRSLAEYSELLATMLRAKRYQIAEKPAYGVTVTSIEQTRGIPYDVYVLCGMVDGEFPQAYSTEHFLGKELPDSEQRHIRAERIQFYQALTNNPLALEHGSWHMLITYPRLTTNGEQLVRSSFVDKLLKVTTLSQRCYNSHELAQWIEHGQIPTQLSWISAVTAPEELQRLDPNTRQINQWQTVANVMLDSNAATHLAALVSHPYSAVELEQYARCPYQYFAERILQLRKPDTYDLALSSLESGSLFHRILFGFYRTLLDREAHYDEQTGFRSIRLDPSRRDEYASLLREIAHAELDRFRHSHPLFALECELILGTDQRRGFLSEWLDRELERFKNGWEYEPALFEIAFGMPSNRTDAVESPIPISQTLSIRGKIDRIEVARRGERVHVVVADYKLNRPGSNNKAIADGRAFQMPFYMLAARTLLQNRYGIEPVLDGGIYYILQPKDEDVFAVAMPVTANSFSERSPRRRSQFVGDRIEQENLLHQAIEHAENIVSQISSGLFPIAPLDGSVCTSCSFAGVCRIQQLHDEGGLKLSRDADSNNV